MLNPELNPMSLAIAKRLGLNRYGIYVLFTCMYFVIVLYIIYIIDPVTIATEFVTEYCTNDRCTKVNCVYMCLPPDSER